MGEPRALTRTGVFADSGALSALTAPGEPEPEFAQQRSTAAERAPAGARLGPRAAGGHAAPRQRAGSWR